MFQFKLLPVTQAIQNPLENSGTSNKEDSDPDIFQSFLHDLILL